MTPTHSHRLDGADETQLRRRPCDDEEGWKTIAKLKVRLITPVSRGAALLLPDVMDEGGISESTVADAF